MTMSTPTTLHRPDDVIVPQHDTQSLGWLLLVLPIVAVGVWYGLGRSRQSRKYPQEHAFRSLSRRMGLGQREINAVRLYAQANGRCSPIAILMDPDRLEDALGKR